MSMVPFHWKVDTMNSENDIEKYLQLFKPEGKEYIYKFCVICDKTSDGSMLMTQYGFCITCLKKLLMLLPPKLYQYIGRVLVFAALKETFVLGDVNQ